MKYLLAPLSIEARYAVVDIFNYYIENTFSAYPESRVSYDFFDTLLNMCEGYPSAVAKDEACEIVGFGMLRPFHQMPVFSRTAEITCFLKPGYTGMGMGQAIFEHLLARGKEQGLASILAGISSLNPGSIRFHLRQGFIECGRFKAAGVKKGKVFDVFYCQKFL